MFGAQFKRLRATIEEEASADGVGVIVPTRFFDAIRQFTALSAARQIDPAIQSPFMLFVVGSPGQGKSQMISASFEKLGIDVVHLSASALGGMYEGDSTTALTEAYLRLGRRDELFPQPCIAIDDIDLSSGRTDERLSGTINSALLNARLMNLADHPNQITVNFTDEGGTGRSKTFSVKPSLVVATANDATQIYRPLLRPGRAFIFRWEPTASEMASMVLGIFPHFRDADARALVDEFPAQPIAFFAQVLQQVVRNNLDDFFSQVDDRQGCSNERLAFDLAAKLKAVSRSVSLVEAVAAAQVLLSHDAGIANHLDAEGYGG